jgi:hypothetical protein
VIAAAGYSGYVAAEYKPTTTTSDSLRWLNRGRKLIVSTIAFIGLGIMGARWRATSSTRATP